MRLAPPDASRFSVRVFGSFEVRVNGFALPRFGRKAEGLLALLVLNHDRVVTRRTYADILYPDTASDAGRYVSKLVLELRKALGEEDWRLGERYARELRFDLRDAWIDLLAFDQAMASGDLLSMKGAVALYRGPFLAGCREDWAEQERETREQEYAKAIARLATDHRARGDLAAAEELLRLAVKAQPLRESLHCDLMLVLAAQRKFAQACQVFRELGGNLRRALGEEAEPVEETYGVFEQIREEARANGCPIPSLRGRGGRHGTASETPTVPASVLPNNLPVPLTRFIGRSAEVARLRELLAGRSGHRLVTLTGVGGCGKSRLALEAARSLSIMSPRASAAPFSDGIWLVECSGLTHAEQLPSVIAASLPFSDLPPDASLPALTNALRFRGLLLVLDNCEHLLDACTHLSEFLLPVCTKIRLLLASREALRLPGEQRYRVPPLSLPMASNATPEALLSSEAVALLVSRAQDAVEGFTVTECNAAAVSTLCRGLDGLPLAIELAAAQLPELPIEELASRLQDRFRLLVAPSDRIRPTHQSLTAVLDSSHDRLTTPQQVLLRRLSVFLGSFTLQAAQDVCRDLNTDPTPWVLAVDDFEELLTQLMRKSLVLDSRDGGPRYRMLETVREYARAKLADCGEESRFRDRHLAWCTSLAERSAPEWHDLDQTAWFAHLDRERDNLGAALDWSLNGHRARLGLRLAVELVSFWDARGYWSEGRRRLDLLLKRDDFGNRDQLRARALNGAGQLAARQGDRKASSEYHTEALEIARQLNDGIEEAFTLHCLGILSLGEGDLSRAYFLFEESRRLRHKLQDRQGVAASLNQLGVVAYRQGNDPVARNWFLQSAKVQRTLGSKRGEASAYSNLGNVAQRQGDLRAARSYLRQALTLQEEINDPYGKAVTLHTLGSVERDQRENERARLQYLQALTLYRDLRFPEGAAGCIQALGLITLERGELSRAAQLLSAATRLRTIFRVLVHEEEGPELDRAIAMLRERLGAQAFQAVWDESQAMSDSEAIACALTQWNTGI